MIHGVPNDQRAQSLVVERIESLEALRALEPEWRSLEERAQLALPFLTFDWVTAWWKHFSEDKPTLRDSVFSRAVRSPSGELIAVAPMMLSERPGFGPLRMREVHFFGADPNVTELRGRLCVADAEVQVHQALLDDLLTCSDRWDWVRWSGIAAGRSPETLLDETARMRWRPNISNFVLPLKSTWEEQRSTLRRNIKESLRKCYNAPLRDHHAIEFQVVSSADGIRAALPEFFRLHRARAEAPGMVMHPDVFHAKASSDFLVDVCDRFAARRMTRVFQLLVDGQVIASRIGFAVNDSMYLYYSGFDPAWSKYSVSTRVTAEAIKYAIAEGYAEANLSTGNDISKTRWGPQERVFREGFMRSHHRRGRLAFRGYQQAVRIGEQSVVGRIAHQLIARRSSS